MSGPPDFEALYRRDPDPWRVASSFYEQRKLDLVLVGLTRPRYSFVWDAACGTGHLAARLADRAMRVLASDASGTAVRLTAELCAGLDNVRVVQTALPEPPARGEPSPDLVMLSEVFYYLNDSERLATLAMINEVAAEVCELVSVHWRRAPDDAWLGGLAGQQEIISRMVPYGWRHAIHHDDEEFVIDTLLRGDPA